MKKVCAWCKKEMKSVRGANANQGKVSHGICPDCATRLFSELTTSIYDFLDQMPIPIALIEDNNTVWGANKAARKMLGKEHKALHGKLGGVVFECVYASLPGGCGKTEHCSGCTIRNTVIDTLRTGKPSSSIPVVLKKKTASGEHDVKMHISTEKIKNVVLLKINAERPA